MDWRWRELEEGNSVEEWAEEFEQQKMERIRVDQRLLFLATQSLWGGGQRLWQRKISEFWALGRKVSPQKTPQNPSRAEALQDPITTVSGILVGVTSGL